MDGESWRGLVPALGLLAASLVLVVAMSLHLPKAGEQVAVVFPPGTSLLESAAVLAAVDARLVRAGGFDSIIVAEFSRDMSLADLRRRGIWFSLDPRAVGGCLAATASDLRAATNRKPDVIL